jgi:hypothetical protein
MSTEGKGIMTYRLWTSILSIFLIFNIVEQTHAGFQDFVKKTMKAVGGEKDLTNDAIVKDLK